MRNRALWVVVGALICQMGLGFGYVFNPLAGEIIADFGWTRAQFSTALSPQLWVISLASPAVGLMVVRFGARRVLIAATVCLSGVFAGFSAFETWWQLTALTIVMGLVVVGVGDITVGQLVTQWVSRKRGLVLGVVYTGSNLGGFLLIPYVVGVADDPERGWRVALSHLAVLAMGALVPAAVWLVRERPGAPGSAASFAAEDSSAAGSQSHSRRDLPLSTAVRTRSFWILAGSLFTFFFYFMAMMDHLVLFLTDSGMSRADAAGYFTKALGLGIVSKIALGVVADRIPYRTAILLDFGLLALSSMLLLLLPDPTFIWLFVISYGFASAARDVVYPLMIVHCFGDRYLASIYGAIMLAMAPGGSCGRIFAGAVADTLGSYTWAFSTIVALNVATVVALAFVRDERAGIQVGGTETRD